MNHSSPTLTSTIAFAGLLAAVWAVAAAIRPTSTFHLAPILITLAVPYLAAGSTRGSSAWNVSIAVAALVSLGATIVLAMADWLAGPSLLPFGGGATEALVFTIVSALVAVGADLTSKLGSPAGAPQQ